MGDAERRMAATIIAAELPMQKDEALAVLKEAAWLVENYIYQDRLPERRENSFSSNSAS